MVKPMVLRRFVSGNESIFTTEPEFEGIEFPIEKPENEGSEGVPILSEEYHLEGADKSVKQTPARIKEIARRANPTATFNSQKYYISIKYRRNVAYLKIRRSKIRMVTMLPEEKVKSVVHSYSLTPLSPSVQKYYGRPCIAINVTDPDHLDEIQAVIEALVADTDADMGAPDEEEIGAG